MCKRMAMAVAIGLVTAGIGTRMAGDEKDDAVAKDMKLLQGDWVMHAFENNGKPISAEEASNVEKGD